MNKHKYANLAEKLRTDIQNGIYVSGKKMPSENELAEMTGFSRQTVRQAIRMLTNEGLTESIQGSGTYVRRIVSQRKPTHNIAVVTTYIGEYIFPVILHGIEHVLNKNGYTSMLSATHNRLDKERCVLTELLHKPIDGLIIEGTKTALPNPNIDLYEQFAELNIPVVFINGYYLDLKNPVYVVADDHEGGRIACETLLAKGHTRIAGIFKSDDIQGHRRYAGYAEALRTAGLTVRDDHVMWYTTENRDSLLKTGTLEALNDCSAVVCYNDEAALQALKVLAEQNVTVPQQIELISFDNSTFAQLSATQFTSLTSSKEYLGRLAAEKMLNILNCKKEVPAIIPWSIE